MAAKPPDLKKFFGKRMSVSLNGGRIVTGRLTGFDVFMNLTLEETTEEISASERRELGVMVVRGNCIMCVTNATFLILQ
jgi:small nuclear ribonucleoprotein G